ncbi:MAG: NTP transferase domain-containing protein, partial [Planctomycetota bacterium]
MRVGGILLGAGKSRRFPGDKLASEMDGRRLLDVACAHFLDAGLEPVLFVGALKPTDPRVLHVAPPAATEQMIATLRLGLRALPELPFAFAPADMPALDAG